MELLVSTWTVDDEYCRHNRENLPLPIQMQLSKEPKTFCHFLIAFLKSKLNFEHFEKKKIEPHCLSISEIIDSDVFTETH